eukprot:289771-Pelagomonas_calceolata.AAC.3
MACALPALIWAPPHAADGHAMLCRQQSRGQQHLNQLKALSTSISQHHHSSFEDVTCCSSC